LGLGREEAREGSVGLQYSKQLLADSGPIRSWGEYFAESLSTLVLMLL